MYKRLPYIGFIYFILSFFQFFKIALIPKEIRMVSQASVGALILLIVIFRLVYSKKQEGVEKNFSVPISLMLIGVCLSIMYCYLIYNQSVLLSLWVNIFFLFFFLYYYLHEFKFSAEDVEKVIVGIGLITVLFFYIQLIAYPSMIFDIKASVARGTIRIFMPGMTFTIITYFYLLNRYFINKKQTFLILLFLCYSIFILQATRQLIGSIGLLTVVYILLSKQVKSKGVILFFILLGMGGLVLIFYDLFIALFSVTQDQSSTESVRVRSIKYFFKTLYNTNLAYIFGNGNGHEGSAYGRSLLTAKIYLSAYLTDIGIIGDYIRWGVFFFIGSVIIVYRTLTIKVTEKYTYLKYYVVFNLFTIFTGKTYFGTADASLIVILFLLDLGHAEYLKDKQTEEAMS